jgi:hypothetical protein
MWGEVFGGGGEDAIHVGGVECVEAEAWSCHSSRHGVGNRRQGRKIRERERSVLWRPIGCVACREAEACRAEAVGFQV